MENQNKYLDKFYKRNMTIEEIKNTYVDNTKLPEEAVKQPKNIYVLTNKETLFLWLFFCGIIYKLYTVIE